MAHTPLFVVHAGADQTPAGRRRKPARDFRLLRLELRDHPGHTFALFNLGMTFADDKKYKRAVRALLRSLAASNADETHVRKIYALLVSSLMHLTNELLVIRDDPGHQRLHIGRQGIHLFSADWRLRQQHGESRIMDSSVGGGQKQGQNGGLNKATGHSAVGRWRQTKADFLAALERASRYAAFSLATVERILAAPARPKPALESWSDEQREQFRDILSGPGVAPRPTSEYQSLLSEEPGNHEPPIQDQETQDSSNDERRHAHPDPNGDSPHGGDAAGPEADPPGRGK